MDITFQEARYRVSPCPARATVPGPSPVTVATALFCWQLRSLGSTKSLSLPAREGRSTRRVVRGRRRRVRMAGVAEGPEVPEQTQAICKAHPTRRQVIVGAVALRCVERRGDRRTAAAEKGCRHCASPVGGRSPRQVSRVLTRHSLLSAGILPWPTIASIRSPIF